MTPTLRAALWMMGSITSFSAMAVAGRELGGSLDTFEIMMYRSLVGVIAVFTLATVYGTWGQINRRDFGTQIGRTLPCRLARCQVARHPIDGGRTTEGELLRCRT